MRILIGTDSYYPQANGVSYFTQRLAHGLIADGNAVLVVAPAMEFQMTRTKIDGVDVAGIRSLSVPFYDKSFRFTPPAFIAKEINQIVQEFKPDVIHVQSHFFVSRSVYDAAKANHVPVVGTNHFMPENFLRMLKLGDYTEHFLSQIGWKQFTNVYNGMDAVTTPTKSAANVLKSIGFKKPVEAISCGIDVHRFTAEKPKKNLRKKYHIPTDKTAFLFVGRIDYDKKLHQILEALALTKHRDQIHMVFAGKGSELDNLKKLSKKLGVEASVTFAGYVPDNELADLYRSVDAFIITSCVELQSIVTLEAMASGLPIIAANAVALPELVHENKNGFLIDPADTQRFAVRMDTLATDKALRTSFGKESRKLVQAHDFPKTIASFERVYKKAATLKTV